MVRTIGREAMNGRTGTARLRIWPVLLVMSLLGMLAAGPRPAAAQAVPEIEDAELIFDQGLQAFEEGDYGMAFRRFRLVYDNYVLNRKTTAAQLMAGRALYRAGRYQEAVDLLAAFVEQYPTSSYLDEARATIAHAREQLGLEADAAETIRLGIALPLGGRDAALTQALFNGIRLAVEQQNELGGGQPRVQMIFRDSRGTPEGAARAVTELAGEGVDVVIGPLYSAEARAAAEAAERAGVVLVAPLATDEDVSEGRRYVFQANPTITMRGRQLARFAVRGLRLNDFGIVAAHNNDSISERMAEGFEEEVYQQGGHVAFYELLPDARGWANLVDAVGADTLRQARVLYLPVSGGRATAHIERVLNALDQAGADVRLLGNAEWHDLPFARQASRYETTYTNDFYVDPAHGDVAGFERRYRDLAGQAPDRLAFTGFDVGRFLIEQAARQPEQPLYQALQTAPPYQGLGIRIDFRNGNVNEALYFFRYRDDRIEQLR